MFLVPVSSLAWRLFRALCWLVAAVLCALVLDLAIVGLFVPMPGDGACPHIHRQAQAPPLDCPCDLCAKKGAR